MQSLFTILCLVLSVDLHLLQGVRVGGWDDNDEAVDTYCYQPQQQENNSRLAQLLQNYSPVPEVGGAKIWPWVLSPDGRVLPLANPDGRGHLNNGLKL